MPSSDLHGPDQHVPVPVRPATVRPATIRPATVPADMAERRAAPRAPLTASCVLVLHGRRHSAGCLDISEVGLGCIIDPAPDLPEISPDLAVAVCLTLGDAVLELRAVVVRAAPAVGGKVVLGMHLRDVSDSHRDQIWEHVYAQLHALRASGRL